MKRYPSYRPAFGFTLIELLAVIAIIAILAALLFPAMATTNEKVRMAKCSVNLRTIASACLLYASDNEGFLPSVDENGVAGSGVYWLTVREALTNYFGDLSLIECPSEKSTAYPPDTDPPDTYTQNGRTYRHCYGGDNFLSRLTWWNNSMAQNQQMRLSRIKWPALATLYYDAFGRPLISNWGNDKLYSYKHVTERHDGFVVARHRGLRIGNVAMADGHVTTFDADVNDEIKDLLNPQTLGHMDDAVTPDRKLYWRRY